MEKNKKNGYTLLELLVTLSITILLTSIFILYSKTGELQFTLVNERSKILGAITQAKSLAVQTYTEAIRPCGYGIYFDPTDSSYFIFRNGATVGPGATTCNSLKDGTLGADYSPIPAGSPRDTVVGQVQKLSSGIRFPSGAVAQTILFIPPDPITLFAPIPAGDLLITIETQDASPSQASIKINSFGQITY